MAIAARDIQECGVPARRVPAPTATARTANARTKTERAPLARRVAAAPKQARTVEGHKAVAPRRAVDGRGDGRGDGREEGRRRSAATTRTIDDGGARRLVRVTTPAVRGLGAEAATVVISALRVVPRRRRAARYAGLLCALVVCSMLAAAAFQTQLARRQVELDKLDQAIHGAREQYEVLRRERASLRSPSRLSEVAKEIGMVPATETGFMVMSPDVLSIVQQSVGTLGDADGGLVPDPLAQFRDVKSVTDGTP